MGKRDDILNATLDLIVEEGIQAVKFAKIFSKANVGSGTVYNYFKNKDELINELFKSILAHMSEFSMKNYNNSATIYERFKFFLKTHVDYTLKYPKEMEFLESYSNSPCIYEEIKKIEIPIITEFFVIISEGQVQGLIRKMDLHLCLQIVQGIISFVIKGHFLRKYELTDVEIEEIIESCWRAIKI